jgi:hypothetical protein
MIIVQMLLRSYLRGIFTTKCRRRKTSDDCRGQADRSQGNRRKVEKIPRTRSSALKDNDDLVNQVVAKYGLEKVQAQRDVDALLEGRHI